MLSQDQIRFLTGLVLLIPLSLVLRHLPSPHLRVWFSLLGSWGMQWWVYGNEIILTVAINLVIYAALRWGSRATAGARITALSMLIGSAFQLYKLFTDYKSWKLDVWTVIMCGVCKHSLLAFAYQDGGDPDILNTRHKHRIQDRVLQLPSLLDYLAYSHFLPNCLINTPMDYARFHHYIHQEKQFSDVPLVPSLLKIVQNVVAALIGVGFYAVQRLYLPMSYIEDPQFLTHSGFYILVYSVVVINLVIAKYVTGFKLGMVGMDAAGFSYEGGEGPAAFDGVETYSFKMNMLSVNPRDKINGWNRPVQEWLRKVVYERVPFSRLTAQLLTFAMSCIWHGFYPGEYIGLFNFFLLLHLTSQVYKYTKGDGKWLMDAYERWKPASHWLLWLVIHPFFTNCGVYFTLMDLDISVRLLNATYWVPILLPILLILYFTFRPKKTARPKKQ